MGNFQQSDFSGGMNMLADESLIGDNQYVWLINGRIRQGGVSSVQTPQLNTTPNGLKQGIYAAGLYLISFVAGRAYYRSINNDTWTQIADFEMSETAPDIYAVLIPASAANFLRKSGASVNDPITIAPTTVVRTPSALLVQDGINQPRLIYVENNVVKTRITGDFDSWTSANPEYVPIGKQMVYHNGKLYIVSADGKEVFHSVTGQPLNFMVNIKEDGDKGGDVYTVSFAPDYNSVTYIGILSQDALLIATQYSIYAVRPDFQTMLFGEPTFSFEYLYAAGVVNQFSVCDFLGDTAFIDYEGIKTFNAIKQFSTEGNANPISLNLARIFSGVKQDYCAAVVFDDYALFAVKTTLGYCIVVFDTLSSQLVAIDILTGIGKIRQFAKIKDSAVVKLFVRTESTAANDLLPSSSQIYELYSSDTEKEYCILGLKHRTEEENIDHRGLRFKTSFEEGLEDTDVFLTERSDNVQSQFMQKSLSNTDSGVAFPVLSPVIVNTVNRTQVLTFDLSIGSIAGRKLGHILKWSGSARLIEVELISQPITAPNSQQQQALIYG